MAKNGASGGGEGRENGTGGVDFEALAMGSESLLSHIARPDGIPRLTKSLAEIERGSQRMGAQATARSRREALHMGVTAEIAEQKQELKGGSMLARNRFDPEALVRVVNAVELRGEYQPLQPLGETDIEGYLAHHHDMIVATAVDETRRAAEEACLVRQREWEVDSWRETKKALMWQMSNGSGDSTGGANNISFGRLGAASQARHVPAGPAPSKSLALYHAPSRAGGVAPLVPDGSINAAPVPVRSKLTVLEADHADVIRSLNNLPNDEAAVYPLASKLTASAAKAVPFGRRSGLEHGYLTGWHILRSVLESGEWERTSSTPRSRLDGTLRFLEEQFFKVLEDKVKKAREAGMLDASSAGDTATGLPPKVRAYIHLERLAEPAGRGELAVAGLPVWPQVYLCIRCGKTDDAVAVAKIAAGDASCGSEEREVLGAVVNELKDPGGSLRNVDTIRHHFERMGDDGDMFKLSVLNMLSRANEKKLVRINKETIEDYMWFKLSFVGGDLQRSDVLKNAQERVSGANGRRRFDANGENTFAYVNVLLYTQQFGEAVAFLHWKGHHLAALHMALAMDHHQAYPAHEDAAPVPYIRNGGEPGPPPSLRELVDCYTQSRVDSDPEVCAEYMVCLDRDSLVDCISSLCLRMGASAASRLLGWRMTDGQRQPGGLDRCLESALVEDIAWNAARKAEAQGRRADAVVFYGLAEELVTMARLLGREIADRLRPNADGRAFWKETGENVRNMMNEMSGTGEEDIDQMTELAREGLDQVLRLMNFFDLLAKKDLFRALQELEAAGMLPRSQEEAAGLAHKMLLPSSDDAVRIVLPEKEANVGISRRDKFGPVEMLSMGRLVLPLALAFERQLVEQWASRGMFSRMALETGMQCLRHHHLEVKRELHGSRPERIDAVEWKASREKRLADLEQRGRAMVALAARISDLLPASFVADLSRLEANIVN